jgi:hypothetical protein
LTTTDVENVNETVEETEPNTQQQRHTAKGAGSPPPTVMTSSVNLIKLERGIKNTGNIWNSANCFFVDFLGN